MAKDEIESPARGFQFGYKTVSYGNLGAFRQALGIGAIIEKALMSKRLGTKAHSDEISALYLYCTFSIAQSTSNNMLDLESAGSPKI